MQVCLISGSYPPIRCGVGDQTERLAAGLAQAGESVTVLTSQSVPATDNPVKVLPVLPHWGMTRLPLLLEKVKRMKPDVVHLQYPSLGFGRGLAPNLLFPALRLWNLSAKRVITLHEYDSLTWKGQWRLWPALRWAHRILCTNQRDLDEVAEKNPGFCDKLRLVPLGSTVGSQTDPAGSPGPEDVFPQDGKTWLLHFGSVMPNKGWEVLVPALQRLRNEGRAVGVLVVSELQPAKYAYHQQVADLIQAAGLSQHIRFTGYLAAEQVSRTLQAGRIAVQPYTDGARLNHSTFIAVLAHSLAVITTDPLYLLEEVKHGRQFWGVLPRDPKALADGIKHLLDQPELVDRLRNAAGQAAGYFSWQRIIKIIRGVYLQQLV